MLNKTKKILKLGPGAPLLIIAIIFSGFLFFIFKVSAIPSSDLDPTGVTCESAEDGNCYASSTSNIYISWSAPEAVDPGLLDHYEVFIGTTTEGSAPEDWHEVASTTLEYTFDNIDNSLNLQDGTEYYVYVRGVDAEDNYGADVPSDPITADLTPPETLILSGAAITDYGDYTFGIATNTDVYINLTPTTDDIDYIYWCYGGSCENNSDYSLFFEDGVYSDPDQGVVHIDDKYYVDIGETGTFNLKYFSVDYAGNREAVKTSDDIIIDQNQPNILSVSATSTDGIYYDGSEVFITVTFDEPVFVTGYEESGDIYPRIGMDVGDERYANYYEGSGSATLVFKYTVMDGDFSEDLSDLGSILFDDGSLSAIKDGVGNDANFVLPASDNPGSLFSNKNIQINVPATVLGAEYNIADGSTPTSTPSATVVTNTVISVAVSGGTSTITMSQGTVITRNDDSNFNIYDFIASSTSIGSLSGISSEYEAQAAFKWGLPNLGLVFNPAITVSIYVGTEKNGETLKVMRSTSGGGGWTDDGIAAPKTCTVVDGLCTFSTTKASYFAALKQISNNGGGGGGIINNCEKVIYSGWGRCMNGKQIRTVLNQYPSSCQLSTNQQLDLIKDCAGPIKDNQKEKNLPKVKVLGVKLYADGAILRGPDKKLYIVKNGKVARIYSFFELKNLPKQKIYNVSNEILIEHGLDNVLLRTPDKKIYYVFNGKKSLIKNLQELAKFINKKVYEVDEDYIERIENK